MTVVSRGRDWGREGTQCSCSPLPHSLASPWRLQYSQLLRRPRGQDQRRRALDSR